MAVTVKPELVTRIANNIADLRDALAAARQSIDKTTAGMTRMARTSEQQVQAKAWAQRIRRLEPQAMAWIYENDGEGATADLARRTLAQATGLRRLLDQLAGRTSRHGEE